jgi:hypothetical protein
MNSFARTFKLSGQRVIRIGGITIAIGPERADDFKARLLDIPEGTLVGIFCNVHRRDRWSLYSGFRIRRDRARRFRYRRVGR